MRQVTVDNLFESVLVTALRASEEDPTANDVMSAISPQSRQELSAALLELLREEVPHEGMEFVEAGGGALSDAQVDSVLFKTWKDGLPQKAVFLRIKDAVADSIVPAAVLGAAAIFGDPMTAVALKALHVLKVLWDKLVVLDRKKDGAVIDTYETLASAIAAKRLTDGGRLTTLELRERMQGMEPDVLKGALKRLAELGLIEVVTWGGAPTDMANDGNAWGVRI